MLVDCSFPKGFSALFVTQLSLSNLFEANASMEGKKNFSKLFQLPRIETLRNVTYYCVYPDAGRCCLQEVFPWGIPTGKLLSLHWSFTISYDNYLLCFFLKKVIIFQYLPLYFLTFKTMWLRKLHFSLQFQYQCKLSAGIDN